MVSFVRITVPIDQHTAYCFVFNSINLLTTDLYDLIIYQVVKIQMIVLLVGSTAA